MMGSLPASSIVSPQRPPSGASPSSLNECVQMLLRLCSSSSAARLTVWIYLEILKQCMSYYDEANLVTVTNTNMIRHNALWLCKNHCCEDMAPSLRQCCAAVPASFEVSRRSAQRSQ